MDLNLQLRGLIVLVRTELIALTVGLFAVVAFQCLTGKIRVRGLFVGFDGRFSATRLQLLMTTFAVALTYLLDPGHFMASPHSGIALTLGGSNLLYLVRKHHLLSG
jgi:hypothetical protein